MTRPVVDADLGGPQGGPRQLVTKADAAGFWTVGTVGAGEWTRDEEKDPRREVSLLIRGTRGEWRFAAIFHWGTVKVPAKEERLAVEAKPRTETTKAVRAKPYRPAEPAYEYEAFGSHRSYWWTAEQRVTVPDTDPPQTYEWTAKRSHPTPVGYRQLLALLSEENPEVWRRPWLLLTSKAVREAGAPASAPAKRKVRTDGVS